MPTKSKRKVSSFAKPISMLVNTYAESIDPDELEELKDNNRLRITRIIGELWLSLLLAKERKVFHTLYNDVEKCYQLVDMLRDLDEEFNTITPEELLQNEVKKRLLNDIDLQLNTIAN